jgi:hypothetical protein
MITAERLVRRMRGGAQAHMVLASDGHHYVTKFVDNPQGRRVLVNEWLGARLLQYLGIACGAPAILEFTPEFLREYDIHLNFGSYTIVPPGGQHFGSRCPVDTEEVALFDFIPDVLLFGNVVNIDDFTRILPFDAWTGNTDARQCVFVRTRIRAVAPAVTAHPLQKGFVAIMIDHGCLFNGDKWEFVDYGSCGLYFRTRVYEHGREVLDEAVDRVASIPQSVVLDAVAEVPATWINSDGDALAHVVRRLVARQSRVCSLVEQRLAHVHNSCWRHLPVNNAKRSGFEERPR